MKTIGSRIDETGPVHIIEATDEEIRTFAALEAVLDGECVAWRMTEKAQRMTVSRDLAPAFIMIRRFVETKLLLNELKAHWMELENALAAVKNEERHDADQSS